MFQTLRRLFTSKDKKPVMLSFILQRDDCSRLLGEFGEIHLPECSKLIIVWQDGDCDINVKTSNSLADVEAAGMLVIAANLVGGNNGS